MRATCAALLAAICLIAVNPASASSRPIDDGSWTTIAVVAAPPNQHRQAPADEYFGTNRLSNLGVRNAIRDMNIEGTSPLALPIQLERIAAVQAAFAVWADRYPSDSWLPGTMLDFAKFLQSKQQAWTDDIALGYLLFLETRYPQTRAGFEAREMRARYHPIPDFDLSAAPPADPHQSVGENLFPKLKSR
ncbi:MAG: hypothetical protein ABI231_09800 [Candidatus Tumulicola sp.]